MLKKLAQYLKRGPRAEKSIFKYLCMFSLYHKDKISISKSLYLSLYLPYER